MKNKKVIQFKDITIESIQDALSKLNFKNKKGNIESYLKSYPEFIEYFNSKKKLTKHDVVIGSHFVYGWMPTILELNFDKIETVLPILNDAKKGRLLEEDELAKLQSCFNNSLVGTSKLLHFINPNLYAIWDSVVFRYLTDEEPYDYRINDYSAYLKYLDLCRELCRKPLFKTIKEGLEAKIDSKVSDMRAIEMIMYETKRQIKNEGPPVF